MSQHCVLVVVLKELDRLSLELRSIVEHQPEDWKKSYASYRRQLGLCITEMVNLVNHDLGLSRRDARVLKATVEVCRAKLSRHQEQHPIDSLVLDGPDFMASFDRVHDCFIEFKTVMLDLIERYEVDWKLAV
jgi:hypothetical protein